MIIIKKIREYLIENPLEFELEHFDNNIYKHESCENIIEFDNISLVYEVSITQYRKPEDDTNSTIDSNPFIDVKIDRLFLNDIEIRLSREQLFTIECILINNIN